MSGAAAIAAASGGDSGGGFGGGGDIYVGPRGILRRGLRVACMQPGWTWSGFTMCWRARTSLWRVHALDYNYDLS